MKIIKIQSIKLINFKGIRDFNLSFNKDDMFIYGANGTGKTSIFDAFNWLLFGKDSNGRSDFEVKTLDTNNKVIEKIEHEVSCELLVNEQPLNLRRVLKESWVKKRGSALSVFSGNVTEYYWNDVPVQQKEFQMNISSLLDEQVFKLVTNTMAFNSLPWKDRRNILSGMVTITDDEIINQNKAFADLMEQIKGHKSIEDFKKMKMASIKKAKEDLANIPTRIDEVTRMKPEAKDFTALKIELEAKQKEIASIDEQIQDKTKAVEGIIKKSNEHALEVNSVKQKLSSIESTVLSDAKKQVNEGKGDFDKSSQLLKEHDSNLKSCELSLQTLTAKKNEIQNRISENERQMESRRNEWASVNSTTFNLDPKECACPTCKRALEIDTIESKKEELLKSFNSNKEESLNRITNYGKNLKSENDSLHLELSNLNELIISKEHLISKINQEINFSKEKIESLKTDPSDDEKKIETIYSSMLSMHAEYISLNNKLSELQKITFENVTVDNSELKASKELVSKAIDDIKTDLAIEKTIKDADDRIVALNKEEQALAQQVADVENIIMIAEDFTKAKIDAIEKRINEKFKFVKFKMFEIQVNGGEAECCEATIKGVPFSDANTASKINAGIDIINTLSEFYQVTAPIFIDNRESVTEVLKTNTQIISLVVSPEDKKLRVA